MMVGRGGRGRVNNTSRAVHLPSLYMLIIRKEIVGEREISRMRMSRWVIKSLRWVTRMEVQARDTYAATRGTGVSGLI